MHGRRSRREQQYVKPVANVSNRLEALLSVVLARVFCHEGGTPIHPESKAKRDASRSYVARAFLAGSKVTSIYFIVPT